jgi:hypothetical protein
MSSTEQQQARALAAELFDTHVVPLATARAAEGARSYFPRGGDDSRASYFDVPVHRIMKADDFEFPGGGSAQGLADALAAAWTAEGSAELAAMVPALKAIAEAMTTKPGDDDDTVSPLIYTMF